MLALLVLLQLSPPAVTYTAKVGSVTSGGVYTAPTAARDTITVTVGTTATGRQSLRFPVTITAAGGTVAGLFFGTPDIYTEGRNAATPFTGAIVGVTPATILDVLAWAKAKGWRLILNTTAGNHHNYMGCPGARSACPSADSLFSWAIWTGKMQGFNTPPIRAAVAARVADGTIVGDNVMDEPHVSGSKQGDGSGVVLGNTWGPPGTMTKVRLDEMCTYMQTLLPGIAAGAAHGYSMFEPDKRYRVCNFNISQYSWRLGSVTAFRDGSIAMARRDGHRVLFGINLLNGGVQDRDGVYDCKTQGGVRGQAAPNCAAVPDSVRAWGLALIGKTPAAEVCGLEFWKYDAAAVTRNAAVLRQLADTAARKPGTPCRRAA